MSKIIFSKIPYQALITEISKEFRGIPIALITDNDNGFSKALSAGGYTVSVISSKDIKIAEHIRCIIAIGNDNLISLAKANKNDRRLFILTGAPSRVSLSNVHILGNRIQKSGSLNTVIIDENKLDRIKLLPCLFNLLTDAIDLLMSCGKRNERLADLREKLMDALICPKDLKSLVLLLNEGEEIIESSGHVTIGHFVSYVNRMRLNDENQMILEFFTAYLVNIMLFKFTFFKNNVILLGADRVRIRPLIKTTQKPVEKTVGLTVLREQEKAFSLTREELAAIAYNFRIGNEMLKAELPVREVLNNILIAYEMFEWDGLTNQLIGQGFVEELLLNGIDS